MSAHRPSSRTDGSVNSAVLADVRDHTMPGADDDRVSFLNRRLPPSLTLRVVELRPATRGSMTPPNGAARWSWSSTTPSISNASTAHAGTLNVAAPCGCSTYRCAPCTPSATRPPFSARSRVTAAPPHHSRTDEPRVSGSIGTARDRLLNQKIDLRHAVEDTPTNRPASQPAETETGSLQRDHQRSTSTRPSA